MAYTGSMRRRRSTRGSSVGWEDAGRSFHEAMAWIGQQKVCAHTRHTHIVHVVCVCICILPLPHMYTRTQQDHLVLECSLLSLSHLLAKSGKIAAATLLSPKHEIRGQARGVILPPKGWVAAKHSKATLSTANV